MVDKRKYIQLTERKKERKKGRTDRQTDKVKERKQTEIKAHGQGISV